jgi:hypothetical protein
MADVLDFDPDMDPFPLDVWFEMSKPITDADVQSVADQMAFNAARAGDPPRCPYVRWSVRRLRLAVQAHNARCPRTDP